VRVRPLHSQFVQTASDYRMVCMWMRSAIPVLLGIAVLTADAAETSVEPGARAPDARAVMTGDQVVQILDETVDWYRTLGAQQQAATQPSDLLILYANRQTADKVVALAFEIARANAELLSSEAGAAKESQEAASSQSLGQLRKKLDAQRASIQSEMEGVSRQLAAAAKEDRANLQARIAALQGELDLVNARRNMLAQMLLRFLQRAVRLRPRHPRRRPLPQRLGPAPLQAVPRSVSSESGISRRPCSGFPPRRARSRPPTAEPRSCRRFSSRFGQRRSHG
jgi:hypothetical protein